MRRLHLWNAIISIISAIVPTLIFTFLYIFYQRELNNDSDYMTQYLFFIWVFMIPALCAIPGYITSLVLAIFLLIKQSESTVPQVTMMAGIFGVLGIALVSGIISIIQLQKEPKA